MICVRCEQVVTLDKTRYVSNMLSSRNNTLSDLLLSIAVLTQHDNNDMLVVQGGAGVWGRDPLPV